MSRHIFFAVVAVVAVLFVGPACNFSDPAEPVQNDGDVESPVPPDTDALDILWTIENTYVSCGYQDKIRDAAPDIFETLDDAERDFHIAVTTPHGLDDELPHPGDDVDPVARAGYLQSEPQPVPAFDDQYCLYGKDSSGEPVEGDFSRFDTLLEDAIECTQDPEEHQHLLDYDEDLLQCAIYDPNILSQDEFEANCDEEQDYPALKEFFPDRESYRDIPTVLRAEDYRDDGQLDVDAVAADFRCMSFVGSKSIHTRQGLAMTARALSPEMTGAPDSADDAPNAGFIRPEAETSLVFVSNRNDCSHDGALDEPTDCGQGQCAIAEHHGGELVSVEELADRVVENLTASKGAEELADSDIHVASVHGDSQRLDPVNVPEQCPEGGYFDGLDTTCSTGNYIATSGHRYGDFLQQFSEHYPNSDENDSVEGLICDDVTNTFTSRELFGIE